MKTEKLKTAAVPPRIQPVSVSFRLLLFLSGSFLFLPGLSFPAVDVPSAPGLLDLNCMEALAATGETDLAGIFSFIPAKNTSAAFADLLVHQPAAMKKFIAKAEGDLKGVGAVSEWDHQALQLALSIYASPLGPTVPALKSGLAERVNALLAAPTLSLEEMERKKK